MKILVVEDEAMELKLARHVLSAAGHSVIGAEAAENAYETITKDRPQIILMDLTLPGMDGLSLVRTLKADPATRDIPIVAVTCNTEKFTRSSALEAGCDAYIVKPLSTRTLPQTLSDVVTGGKAV